MPGMSGISSAQPMQMGAALASETAPQPANKKAAEIRMANPMRKRRYIREAYSRSLRNGQGNCRGRAHRFHDFGGMAPTFLHRKVRLSGSYDTLHDGNVGMTAGFATNGLTIEGGAQMIVVLTGVPRNDEPWQDLTEGEGIAVSLSRIARCDIRHVDLPFHEVTT